MKHVNSRNLYKTYLQWKLEIVTFRRSQLFTIVRIRIFNSLKNWNIKKLLKNQFWSSLIKPIKYNYTKIPVMWIVRMKSKSAGADWI